MSQQTRRDALSAAIDAVGDASAVSTFLLRGMSLAECEVSEITLSQELTDTVIGDVVRFAEQLVRREFLDYDPSYQLASNQAIADDLTEVPPLAAVHEVVARGDVETDEGGEVPVLAMVHRLESPGAEAITVYRLKGAGIATKRARGVLALLPNGGVFREVDHEILYYEPRFDALVHEGAIVVTTITLLSRQLESPARAQEKARAVFAKATQNVAISGVEELTNAVAADPAMNAKMMAVSRLLDSDPEYAALLTTEKLVDFLAQNPHIEIEVEGAGPDAKLVFDPSPQKRYRIPKALADDYLSSRLTGRDYEAGSKQRL